MTTADRVVLYLRRHPDAAPTAREIADTLRIPLADANTALRDLERTGQVRKGGIGWDRSRAWILTEEG